MEPIYVLLGLIFVAAASETFFMRKDLRAQDLHLWLYLGFPLLALSGIFLMFWDEMPEDIGLVLITWSGAAASIAFFVGVIWAIRRER